MGATDNQRDVIALLSKPETYGLPADAAIECIETHISIVWLAGDRAYKLKRSVMFDYVNFSTSPLRHAACEAEVRLNRRTAPSLYLGVRAVTREPDGSLALGGTGAPVDWLVEMMRFDQASLFDRLAQQKRLDLGLMEGVADAIARLHAIAEPHTDRGGRDDMAWVVDGNCRAFAEFVVGARERDIADSITASSRAAVERHAGLLDDRRRRGFVRSCHGDLHLRNICLLHGIPTLFDGVEFNDQIACVDVLYDLAFLLMDLWHRELPVHANVVFNAYLARALDLEGLPLLPLFLSCRAAIRAKTSATAARLQSEGPRAQELVAATREYLVLAERLLRPPAPCLVAIGGFSGSGKSTLARQLAHMVGAPPGALILRSDVIRKELLGVPPSTHLGADAYRPELTRRVYETVCERARLALRAGQAVIADAVFADPRQRETIASVARRADVPFRGLWLEGSPALLAARLETRAADVSDATVAVLDHQLRTGAGPMEWQPVDGSPDRDTVRAAAEGLVMGLR